MAELKLNISDPKTGKTHKHILTEENNKPVLGKKIGQKIKGDDIGFAGYEFDITGGSDNCGFPMRQDVSGTARRKILIVKSVGSKGKRDGMRKRKTVSGSTINSKTSQVNLKVAKAGKGPLFEEKKEEKKEEATEDKK